jgi:hypothetical protein
MVTGPTSSTHRAPSARVPRHRSFAEQSLHYFVREHGRIPDAPIDSPAAWRGGEIADRPETWRHPLPGPLLDELEHTLDALEHTIGQAEREPADIGAIDPRRWPLPGLAAAAAGWCETLARGRGFLVLTGLPVERWSQARSERAFWLLGHLIGIPGAQNAVGELLGHVVDYGEQPDSPHVRLYRTPSHIGFHCDAADVVGLLCLETAARGGASRIASSVAIWNALFESAPELARLLFEPFAVDRRDEQPEGARPFFEMPPCRFGPDGALRTFYHGEYFRSVQRLPEVGPLPAERLEALDRYDAIGADPRFRLDMQLERGDLQLLSNHTIVHARTAYEEHPGRKRHLLRLWLSLDD